MNPTEEARLREAFADAADGVTPGPVPLAAVVRSGRARHRRRTAGLAACCGLLVAALAVTAHRFVLPMQNPPAAAPAAPTASPPPAPPEAARPRIVRPGERVRAAPDVLLWLTAQGKHWSAPDGGENFRSVTDGNLDLASPGITHQAEGRARGVFHSGIYYGTKAPARVEIGNTAAALLELPGSPGWGVWYATTPSADPGVTLYDGAGRVLARLPGRAAF
ncbi:hypothetical protein [Streptomyces lavendulocolor]|uniref:hypothetical protein n=1 Tax=Streptomyces lavendulocolor TaxID=67316 RepID=UPI0031D8984F